MKDFLLLRAVDQDVVMQRCMHGSSQSLRRHCCNDAAQVDSNEASLLLSTLAIATHNCECEVRTGY